MPRTRAGSWDHHVSFGVSWIHVRSPSEYSGVVTTMRSASRRPTCAGSDAHASSNHRSRDVSPGRRMAAPNAHRVATMARSSRAGAARRSAIEPFCSVLPLAPGLSPRGARGASDLELPLLRVLGGAEPELVVDPQHVLVRLGVP